MNYTQEDYEYMGKFEYHLNTAVNNNYCRIDSKVTLKAFADIYKRTLNKDSKLVTGCSHCVLKDIKTLANLYFSDKAEYEAIEKAQNAIETPVEASQAEAVLDTTPKAGKPALKKKTAKNKKK